MSYRDRIKTSIRELSRGPLHELVGAYVQQLHDHGYADGTICHYLAALVDLSYWLKQESNRAIPLTPAVLDRFLKAQQPSCSRGERAAWRRLKAQLSAELLTQASQSDAVSQELQHFVHHMDTVCGLAASTQVRRCQTVDAFLRSCGFAASGEEALTVAGLETFLMPLMRRLKPSGLNTVLSHLRSYFRFRALQGTPTAVLLASLPKVATWGQGALPRVLSEAQVELFLNAFNLANPLQVRDYAIARCLLDLGLRGEEATLLTLDDLDWRRGTVTLVGSKSRRAQQLPLPVTTGEAVATYLKQARPQTAERRVFVRHRAPRGVPLTVPAIRNAMNRAFTRCGLRNQFCNTHVLRRTAATRMQCAGASVKAIADLLRHRTLDTARVYARVDIEQLRTVALPWPGALS